MGDEGVAAVVAGVLGGFGGSAHVCADQGDGILLGLSLCFGPIEQIIDFVEVFGYHKIIWSLD